MTLQPITRPEQYRDVERLEFALRTIADMTPAWLYDETRLGSLIDSLNEARYQYEQEDPATKPLTGMLSLRPTEDPARQRP